MVPVPCSPDSFALGGLILKIHSEVVSYDSFGKEIVWFAFSILRVYEAVARLYLSLESNATLTTIVPAPLILNAPVSLLISPSTNSLPLAIV